MGRILGAVGRVLIALGVLTLLFVVYQLWGTNLQEARSQDRLHDQLDQQQPGRGTASPTTTTSTRPTTSSTAGAGTGTTRPATPAPADVPMPAEGDPIGIIQIPRIGVDKVFVEGVSRADLRKGPGHYPGTPLPGQRGNAAIAGHRTTYGAPFNRIDELRPGDEILISAPYGRFRYEVRTTTIVSPSQGDVLADKGDNRLTLTSCEPKYSARHRIVVAAALVGEPVGKLRGQVAREREIASSDDGRADAVGDLAGPAPAKLPVVVWGLLCAAIWAATWAVSRLLRARGASRLVRWSPFVVGLPLFLLALYVCFENVADLLPPNF